MTLKESDTLKYFMKPIFITKVHVTKLTKTPVGIKISVSDFDETTRCQTQLQKIVQEYKNHFIIEARCGEAINLLYLAMNEEDEKFDEIVVSKKSSFNTPRIEELIEHYEDT